MGMRGSADVKTLLAQGIAAARDGRVDEARGFLTRAVDLDPENETAWLWMSGVVPDDEKIACLRTVLEINPSHELARRGLAALLERLDSVEEEVSPLEPEEPPPVEPLESEPEPLAAVDEVALEKGRSCLAYVGVALLGVIAFAVCGAAAVFGGKVLTANPQQSAPTTTVAGIPVDTFTPVPEFTFPPTFTPTPTLTPVPTNTLVVPDARIPGFPIVSEGAYDEVEARVSELREMAVLRDVQMVTFTRYRLEDYLTEWYEQEEYVAELDTLEKLYRALGLIEEDYDLAESQIETLREYIAGLYDPETEEIYLILDRYASDLWLEVTFAHEFTHALQDQHFDLDALQERSPTTDSRLALQALVEGDATLVMMEYAFKYLFQMNFERSDLLEAIQQVEQGEYEDAPTVVRETAWFPYDQGLVFAAALVEKGGWERLNEAFQNPPQTTEQIMHPDKYLAGEIGQSPEVGDLAGVMGSGWQELSRDVLGELFVRVYLERELSSEDALMAGEGWEGDTAVFLYDDEQDRYLFALRISWDSEANAQEYLSFYTTFMQLAGDSSSVVDEPDRKRWESEGQVVHSGRSGRETLLVLASDAESMDRALTAFSGF